MGIWQFFQAMNVILCPIHSIYPSNRNPNIRVQLEQSHSALLQQQQQQQQQQQTTTTNNQCGHLCKV